MIGVSVDRDERNDEFRAECGLDFPLVSDAGAEPDRRPRLLKDYGEYGRARPARHLPARRRRRRPAVWDVTDAAAHPDEVLDRVLPAGVG